MPKLHPEAVENITFAVDWNDSPPDPEPSVDVSFDHGDTWHETDDGVLLIAGPDADANDGVTLELGRTVPLLKWDSGDQVIIRRSDEAIDVGHAPTVSEVDEGGGGGSGADGEDGTDGNTILNGEGPPASGTGLDPVNGEGYPLDDLDGINDPWRWCEQGPDVGVWISPAYEVSWAEGDETPAFSRPLGSQFLDLFVGPWVRMGDAGVDPDLNALAYQAFPDQSTSFVRDLDDLPGSPTEGVMLTTGTGIAYMVQAEPGYTHTAVPDANVDITTMLGDITIGDQWEPGPWRWHPGRSSWIGPAYEVTWSEGDHLGALLLPDDAFEAALWIGSNPALADALDVTVGPVPWEDENTTLTKQIVFADPAQGPAVAVADGTGYVFIEQYEPDFGGPTRIPAPDLDVLDYLGDVTVGDAYEWPETSTGVDGDFYIDTDAWDIYGPKADDVWPDGVSLIGPEGPAGP